MNAIATVYLTSADKTNSISAAYLNYVKQEKDVCVGGGGRSSVVPKCSVIHTAY